MIEIQSLPPIVSVIGSIGKLKILELLAIEGEVNVTAISNKTGVNHTRVKIHLESLLDLNIVEEKRFGRIKIYKLNAYNEASKKIGIFLRSWSKSKIERLMEGRLNKNEIKYEVKTNN